MKITLKNARKTLRFVTARELGFSFRAVSFFSLFLFIYFYFFSRRAGGGGVNDYFNFFYLYPTVNVAGRIVFLVKSEFPLPQINDYG